MIRTILPFLLLSPLTGVEIVVRDLRLGLATQPAEVEFTYSDAFGSHDGTDSLESAYEVQFGTRYSWAFATGGPRGIEVGLDLVAGTATFGGEGSYQSIGGRVHLGLVQALGDRFMLEVGGYVGYGLAWVDLDTTGGGSLSADGTRLEYGAQAAVCWALGNRWRLGLSGGWGCQEASLSGTVGSMDTDLDLRSSGFVAGLSLSFRFASLPRGLE